MSLPTSGRKLSKPLFVAVDIGCLECGEPSEVLGIFTNKEEAEAICTEAEAYQAEHWHGQHEFQVFEVPEINVSTWKKDRRDE